jgi:hypothetical protein
LNLIKVDFMWFLLCVINSVVNNSKSIKNI